MSDQESATAGRGRPSLFDPAYCERVITLAKEGMGPTEIASELSVHRDSLYEWAKVHPDFSDAFSRAKLECQAWWERQGRLGLTLPGFNASLWSKNMGCRFKDEWADTSKHELTGKDGKDLPPATVIFQPVAARDPESHG